jgi:hypothetical protein
MIFYVQQIPGSGKGKDLMSPLTPVIFFIHPLALFVFLPFVLFIGRPALLSTSVLSPFLLSRLTLEF